MRILNLFPVRNSRTSFLSIFAILLTILAFNIAANAQCVSLTTLGAASTQNFDTLSNTAGSTTNNLLITGWFMTESGGGARDNEQYAVDTGGSTTGDTYSFGSAAATDRALGGLRSGTLIPIFGACFTNNTGATIGSLAVNYTGEEWRLGTAARVTPDQISFEYSLNATDLTTGTFTAVPALNFITPDNATVGAKNGNAASARTALSSSITGLSVANGATFWIRWTETDASGADDGLAVDDFSLTPMGPTAASLSIAGRVATTGGRGIGGVRVMIADQSGQVRTALTSPLGYYRLDDVPAGNTYVITVSSKTYTFSEASQLVMVDEAEEQVNFIADNIN